jgi:hypothetical protein
MKDRPAEARGKSQLIFVANRLVGSSGVQSGHDIVAKLPKSHHDWVRKILVGIEVRHERSSFLIKTYGFLDLLWMSGIIVPGSRKVVGCQSLDGFQNALIGQAQLPVMHQAMHGDSSIANTSVSTANTGRLLDPTGLLRFRRHLMHLQGNYTSPAGRAASIPLVILPLSG